MNKILMIAACPFPGNRGTPSRILKMAEALKRAGNAVDILTYHNRDFEYKDKIINIFRTPKIPLIETNSPGPKIYKLLADFMLILKGLGLCKQKRYDLIHAHHIEGTICGLSLKGVYNIPVIYDAHIIVDDEVPTYKRYKFKPIKLFLNLLENICLNKSFFFQAEDGIRDWSVTGVQTCALFFSSRRRHTRLVSDWSSDVCSSDRKYLFSAIKYF